ncbi:MAG: glycosyltransferase family 2 protein [Candidatus Dojkabacteria bacterium]
MKLSLIVPTYYKEQNLIPDINRKLNAVENFLTPDQFELIYVFDGIDRTNSTNNVDLIEKWLQSNEKYNVRALVQLENQGKGKSIMTGIDVAKGEFIGFIDFGNDIDLEVLERMYKELRFDQTLIAVLPNKNDKRSHFKSNLKRKLFTYGYILVANLLTGIYVPDSQTGCKMFRGPYLKAVKELILVKRYAFDIELLAALKVNGFKKWKFVPIRLNLVDKSSVRTDWIIQMFLDTLAIGYRMFIKRWYRLPDPQKSVELYKQ